MSATKTSGPVLHDFERPFLEKLRLAAVVILEAASDLDFVTSPFEVELYTFKDRVEQMLLLPGALSDGDGT